MTINKEQLEKLESLYQTFLNDEKVLRMQDISMHRGSNCYLHCFKVAKKAISKSLNKKNINLEVVLVGAILHDYYLYDWRKDRSKLKKHAKNHPHVAIENAIRDFAISDDIKRVIETHMWPINFKAFPNTKEAKVVSLADKAVTIGESLTGKRYKQKKREKYLSYISHLF